MLPIAPHLWLMLLFPRFSETGLYSVYIVVHQIDGGGGGDAAAVDIKDTQSK